MYNIQLNITIIINTRTTRCYCINTSPTCKVNMCIVYLIHHVIPLCIRPFYACSTIYIYILYKHKFCMKQTNFSLVVYCRECSKQQQTKVLSCIQCTYRILVSSHNKPPLNDYNFKIISINKFIVYSITLHLITQKLCINTCYRASLSIILYFTTMLIYYIIIQTGT